MTSTTDLKKLYRFSILSPKEFFEFDFSTLLILTKEKDRLTIADTLGFPEAVIGNFSLVEGQGLSTYVIQNKKAEGVTDLDAETRFEVPGIVREFGIHSAVCVPMMIQDEIIGALIGHTRVKRVFTAEDISIYQNIANHAAVAIKNAMNLEELKCLNEVLACQATTDPLTGIANRAKFSEVLESELARSNRFALPLSLIMFDIDQFKKINDTYGHNAGDDVLRELSAWVSKSVRKHDLFTRWGGEEFMIMFTNSTKSKATLYAEKLRLEIEALDFPQVGRVTCSFGVAEFEKDLTVDSLVQKADVALYRAKSAGRNRVEAN
jgi:diguanylate cyclase (GGDEF)-like protein